MEGTDTGVISADSHEYQLSNEPNPSPIASTIAELLATECRELNVLSLNFWGSDTRHPSNYINLIYEYQGPNLFLWSKTNAQTAF